MPGEVGREAIDGRARELPAHRLAITLALLMIGEERDSSGVALRRRLGIGLQDLPDLRQTQPALQSSRSKPEQLREPEPSAPRQTVELRQMAHRAVSRISEKGLVATIAVERHGNPPPRHLGD